jgi:hypothetical protein
MKLHAHAYTRTVAPLIRKLGPKADPSNLKRLPLAAAAVWALYAGVCKFVGIVCRCV